MISDGTQVGLISKRGNDINVASWCQLTIGDETMIRQLIIAENRPYLSATNCSSICSPQTQCYCLPRIVAEEPGDAKRGIVERLRCNYLLRHMQIEMVDIHHWGNKHPAVHGEPYVHHSE